MDRIGADTADMVEDMAEASGDVEEDKATEVEEGITQQVDKRHRIFPLQVTTTRNQCMADTLLNLSQRHLICLPNPTTMDNHQPFKLLKIHLRSHPNNIPSR
ncbi:hypothetical protein N7463_008936 [Penicillium fimorum]|uniref:Uncharacterized protein n=1 Tax=Penicillium fimorum TaxID=1882269 RepID=A0A9W9XPS9_9EURO|nr:hypothetical protein N7463_008936 [Penicillium fimorum]